MTYGAQQDSDQSGDTYKWLFSGQAVFFRVHVTSEVLDVDKLIKEHRTAVLEAMRNALRSLTQNADAVISVREGSIIVEFFGLFRQAVRANLSRVMRKVQNSLTQLAYVVGHLNALTWDAVKTTASWSWQNLGKTKNYLRVTSTFEQLFDADNFGDFLDKGANLLEAVLNFFRSLGGDAEFA